MAPARTDNAYSVPETAADVLRRPGWVRMLERVLLGAVTMILTFNVWTGFPLLALWIGSRFAFGDKLSMGAIVIALVALGAMMFVVFTVVVAFVTFEVWFFFLAKATLPQ